jgi:hypothetical protein
MTGPVDQWIIAPILLPAMVAAVLKRFWRCATA